MGGEIGAHSLPAYVYTNLNGVEEFLGYYSETKLDFDVISADLSNPDFVGKLHPELHTQLLTNAMREAKILTTLHKCNVDIQGFIVKNNTDSLASIQSLIDKNEALNQQLKDELNQRLGISEINWLQNQLGADSLLRTIITKDLTQNIADKDNAAANSDDPPEHPPVFKVSRWLDAEAKCIAIEKHMGNTASDVSLKNLGYSVESYTPEHKRRYIKVITVQQDYAFSLTSREYTTASQHGDDYYICLLYQTKHELKARYIQNPLKNAEFEKIIKQWEWACTKATSTSYSFDLEN